MAKKMKKHYDDGAGRGDSVFENKTKMTARPGTMISEDYSKPGNMPDMVMMKDYPKPDYAEYSPYPDSLEGNDEQIGMDERGMKRQRSGIKY